MAVISTPNLSTVKIKYDKGMDLDGNRVTKVKSYSSVNYEISNEDIMEVVEAIVALQDHTMIATNRVDNISLSV